MAKKMGFLGWTAYILVALAAIEWGIYAVSRWISGTPWSIIQALSNAINPADTVISGVIYIIVGAAGIYALAIIPKLAKK